MADPCRNTAPQNRATAPPEPNPSAPGWRAADDPAAHAAQDRRTKTASPNARLVPASFPSTNTPRRENHASAADANRLLQQPARAGVALVFREQIGERLF